MFNQYIWATLIAFSGSGRVMENESRKLLADYHYRKQEQTMSQNSDTNKPTYRVACGGTTQDLEKHPSAMYRGERIAFCTFACLKAFENDPDRFMAGEIEHPGENDLPSAQQ
jgi:YHS domain-containing protein